MGRALAWRRGGFFEYGSTLIGARLFTVFTPWFGLMMIFIFGAQLRWLPLGKFLDPALWSKATISGLADSASKANYVFNRMLITTSVALVLWVLMVVLIRNASAIRRRQVQSGGTLALLAAAVGVWALRISAFWRGISSNT